MAQQPFNRNFRKPVQKEDEHRINQRIRVPQVRLVGDNVEQGIFETSQALAMAQAQSLDLVEIVPTANPPVCRVIDYSKFKYDQKKKQKETKATTKTKPKATLEQKQKPQHKNTKPNKSTKPRKTQHKQNVLPWAYPSRRGLLLLCMFVLLLFVPCFV